MNRVRSGRNRVVMLRENNPYPQDYRTLAEARSLAAAGYNVSVVAPRAPGQPRRERLDGVDVVRYRGFDGSNYGAVGFLLEYLLAWVALHLAAVRALCTGAWVLHILNPPDILFCAGALFRLTGRRVVFDHCDLFPETVAAKFGSGPFSWLASHLGLVFERLSFAVANHVISTNVSFREIAIGRGQKARNDVTIVRTGPPSAWTRLPVRVRDGALRRVRLTYLGAISLQDNVDGLAPVLAIMRELTERVVPELTIVGDGDARAAVEAEFRRYNVIRNVTFTGWVAFEQLPKLLEAADVCVDPAAATAVNERSTMSKIAEYMALGKPVVAYDLLETRRTAGGVALLVPPGDAWAFAERITLLASRPELRLRLAHAGRRAATELTWDHSERSLLEAYASLKGDRPRSRQARGLRQSSGRRGDAHAAPPARPCA